MKTKELKEIARENGYEFNVDGCSIFLIKEIEIYGRLFKNVIKINRLACKSIWINNSEYVGEMDVNMMEASIAYARTPEEEREEPKKFYLRHKWVSSGEARETYLNKAYINKARIEASAIYFISTKDESSLIQTKFTQIEIEEIKSRFDTNLKDFEQIEVEE